MYLSRISCPSCSAPVDVRGKIVSCQYCGSQLTIDEHLLPDPDLSELFAVGLYGECFRLCSVRLQRDCQDSEAAFYRGLARLFEKQEDYLVFDKIVLNLTERIATPVGDEALIHADLKLGLRHGSKYLDVFSQAIRERINDRPRFQFYRKDLELRILHDLEVLEHLSNPDVVERR